MFEYKIEEINGEEYDEITSEINESAKYGWRVCKILKKGKGKGNRFNWYDILFEREVK